MEQYQALSYSLDKNLLPKPIAKDYAKSRPMGNRAGISYDQGS